MKAVEFTGQNLMLNPPENMEHGACGALPVLRCDDRMISVWRPDSDDIKAITEGAHVLLHVWGQGHPPVGLTVQKMEELP